jgi:hypothetical protein
MDPGTNMLCLNKKGYLPVPPNAWYRVQNSCSLVTGPDPTDGFVTVPYSGQVVPYVEIGQRLAMLSKGNVLQYKKNSSNLTKQQRYAQIAKGQWTNRTKSWATQSTRGYTNPNTSSYIREGSTNVTSNGTPTTAPVTCPALDFLINNVLPFNIAGGFGPTKIPPPIPPKNPNTNDNVLPLVPVATPADTVIQDFGNLVCGSYQNLCTGEFLKPFKLENCHPTSDSDVPGQIQDLCWNDGTPTWYPRQRYVMNNSGDKWPVNAPLGNAIQIAAPTLFATLSSCDIITLSWQMNDFFTSFNIFQNGNYLNTVNGTTTSYQVTVTTSGTYSFYIKGYNGNTESHDSNTVSVTVVIEITTNGSITNYNPLSGNTTVTGYTYILFNNVGSFYFNTSCNISNFYYMIVGQGGNAQSGFTGSYYSIGGDGGGAGGIWNGVTSLSSGNYSITIPAVNNIDSATIQNASSSSLFNITATTGGFINRGAVNITINSSTTTLSPASSTDGSIGVGGQPSEVTQVSSGSGGPFTETPGSAGGAVYLGSNGSSGNYMYFLGDNILSNTLFGGGGGGGGRGDSPATGTPPTPPTGSPAYPATTGYNGGGGGGGGGVGLAGGTGVNGLTGNNNGGSGGNAFTNSSITSGYGGGGGGGGSITVGGTNATPRGPGGTGGPAMLMIYFTHLNK